MLDERQWVHVIACAARKDEETAKNYSPEFYKAYLSVVKDMEENEKKGIKCTYDVGYGC